MKKEKPGSYLKTWPDILKLNRASAVFNCQRPPAASRQLNALWIEPRRLVQFSAAREWHPNLEPKALHNFVTAH